MNRTDDFDQTLSAWLRSEAPPQAPDRVLDAALGRVASQAQQRGWTRVFSGGALFPRLLRGAAVVAALAVAVIVGYELSSLNASVGPTQAPSVTPSVSPTPLPSPSIEPTATPAVPAALLLRLNVGSDAGSAHVLTVLDDGRAISTSSDNTARAERVLTPAGIQLLQDELTATGLTGASGRYMPVANPGVEPPGFGLGSNTLEVALSGDETAVINWYLYADTAADYYKPQPEAETLDALRLRLGTLEEWLPASAWAEASSKPYVPTQYRIYVFSFRSGAALDQFGVETSTVTWPLIDGVDVYGNVVDAVAREKGDAGPFPRCRIVSVEEGAAVVEALQAAGAGPSGNGFLPGTALELGHRANGRQVVVNLEPILPFEDTSCGRGITKF